LPKSINASETDEELLKILGDDDLNSLGVVHLYGDRKPWSKEFDLMPSHVRLAQGRWIKIYEELKSFRPDSLLGYKSPLTNEGVRRYLRKKIKYPCSKSQKGSSSKSSDTEPSSSSSTKSKSSDTKKESSSSKSSDKKQSSSSKSSGKKQSSFSKSSGKKQSSASKSSDTKKSSASKSSNTGKESSKSKSSSSATDTSSKSSKSNKEASSNSDKGSKTDEKKKKKKTKAKKKKKGGEEEDKNKTDETAKTKEECKKDNMSECEKDKKVEKCEKDKTSDCKKDKKAKNRNREQDRFPEASSSGTQNLFTFPQVPVESTTSNKPKKRGNSRTTSIFSPTSDSTMLVQPVNIKEDQSEAEEPKKGTVVENDTDTDQKNDNDVIRKKRGRKKRLRIPSTVNSPPADELSSRLNEEYQEVMDEVQAIESNGDIRQGRKRMRMPNLFLDPIDLANNRQEEAGDAEAKETPNEEREQQGHGPKRLNLWGSSHARRRHLRNEHYAFKMLPKDDLQDTDSKPNVI